MKTPDDHDPLISLREMADQAGIRPDTMRNYRRQGRLPPPDDMPTPDRPRWRQSTFDAWMKDRPGRGTRTDLQQQIRIRIGRVRGAAQAPGPWRNAVRDAGMTPSVRMVSVERRAAPADVAARLDIEPGAAAIRRVRDCLADDVVIQHHEAWYPAAITEGSRLERPNGVGIGIFEELARIGHEIGEIVEEVYARPASQAETKLFRMPPRIPVIVLERLTRDTAGLPVEFLRIVSAGNRALYVYEGSPL